MEPVNFDRAAGYYDKTRKPFGAQAPAAVTEYLAGRATARELSPVPVRTVWTLGEAIDHEAATAVRCWAFELRY